MPPKPAPGKKGKEDLEDYSDVHLLPPLNSVIVSLQPTYFFSLETRDKVQKAIQDKIVLNEPRVKTVTRDELLQYAKLKQIIVEPNVAATLPQDDPRLKMNEAEQLAKAACDKVFELSVQARRAKKERIQKHEEELKLQQQQNPDATHAQKQEDDTLDLIFNFSDYPSTKQEILALASRNMSVNIVIDVQQNVKQIENQGEEELVSSQEQNTYVDSQRQHFFLEARQCSIKSSPLRHLILQSLPFYNCPSIAFKTNEHGEEVEERKEAEAVLVQEIMRKIEYLGVVLLKYKRFRERVPLMPLMPDKQAMQRIEEIKRESEEYHQWLLEGEQLTLNQSQKELSQSVNVEDREQRKAEFENERQARQQEEEDRKRLIKELQAQLKVSVDDNKQDQAFPLTQYQQSFIKHQETQNCLSAIMSSMVSQIANGEEKYIQTQENENEGEASTAAESTIDDLFSDIQQEIYHDLLPGTRPAYNNSENQLNQSYTGVGVRQRKQGAQPFATQTSVVGEIEYHEENDKSKVPLFRLPKEVTHTEEEMAEEICLREKSVLENLVLPGINRHLMPEVASKSLRIRDSERPQLYPFSTLPIEDAERALIMRAFQDLIKSNFIDEGQPAQIKHAKYKSFERNFESHMKPEILRQVLAEAFLREPDVATLYYPRNDCLLVALYNKVKELNEEASHQCEREWKAAYRVMPDFENWVKYFADEVLIPSQQSKTDPNSQVKYSLDDEMIPEQMLDIDDQKIQNISEHSDMLYPPDGSIMKVDTYTIGGVIHKKSVVYKDNISFGLRKSDQSKDDGEQQFGLYQYKKQGDLEFWMSFENDIRLLVENIYCTQNEQKLIRIDPPKPTPEEIAAREEAIKQAQALAAKTKNKSALANLPVIEEYKPPEPTWEPAPLDFFDTLIYESITPAQTNMFQVTSTFPNGLIIKHMGDGNIVQLNETQLGAIQDDQEVDRVILRKSGVVVRHFKNREAEVLFPDGVTAKFDKQDMSWVVTNNKGRRTMYKAGIKWDIESIPCAKETDAVTNATMMIREDKVLTIQFKDKSLYCQHADGTLMLTDASGTQIRIEKEGYAPIIVHKLPQNETSYEARNESVNITDIKQRQLGGYLMETHMPDGTVVETFEDFLISANGVRHLFRRQDFTVVCVDSEGKIDVVSSNTRSALNELYGKRLMGQDTDYQKGIFQFYASFNVIGVYHALLGDGQKLFTVGDKLDTQYTIDCVLNLQKLPNDYQSFQTPFLSAQIQDNSHYDSQAIEDGQQELEEVGGYKNPVIKHFVYPRLFVIQADGSGHELLTKEQLEYYFRIAKHRPECLKQRTSVMVGTTLAKTHYFVTRVKTMHDKEQEQQQLKSLEFPQNAQYALLHNKVKSISKHNKETHILPFQYMFRQIFEFQEFESYKQDAFYDDYNRYRQWKMSQIRYDSEFGIVHIPAKDQVLDFKKIEDEEYFAKRIIAKIMKERRKGRKKFEPDEFKLKFLQAAYHSDDMTEFQRRNTFAERDTLITQGGLRDHSDLAGLNSQFDNPKHMMLQESMANEKHKNIKKKQEMYVQQQLQEIRRMINTPTFLPTYFQSKQGMQFVKNNPQKPPSQEMIMRMSQRINRSQGGTEKGNSQFGDNNAQSQRGENQSPALMQENQDDQQDQDHHNPIVALHPEDQYNNGRSNNFMQSKQQNAATSGNQPSLYLQEKMYVKQKEQEHLLKAEEYHVVKTKDFNVVGRLRQDLPFVKTLQKSQVQSELNEKFITTECIADRRVKISSMANRQYIQAPSIEQVRKQGQHQMILSAINKKQTFAELINQANSMVTSVLHDPLKRSLNILPSSLQFGMIQSVSHGQAGFEMIITMKNEDQQAQRVTIKPLNDKRIIVQQLETGPIATGMTRKISVTICSPEECTIKETLQIVTKTDIFKVPIEAQVLSPENYQKEVQEQRAINGKTITNSRVRNKLNDSIIRGRMSAKGERHIGNGSIDGGSEEDGGRAGGDWMETTNSHSKLPQIPQADRRAFEVDPKKPLKDLLKR